MFQCVLHARGTSSLPPVAEVHVIHMHTGLPCVCCTAQSAPPPLT